MSAASGEKGVDGAKHASLPPALSGSIRGDGAASSLKPANDQRGRGRMMTLATEHGTFGEPEPAEEQTATPASAAAALAALEPAASKASPAPAPAAAPAPAPAPTRAPAPAPPPAARAPPKSRAQRP